MCFVRIKRSYDFQNLFIRDDKIVYQDRIFLGFKWNFTTCICCRALEYELVIVVSDVKEISLSDHFLVLLC